MGIATEGNPKNPNDRWWSILSPAATNRRVEKNANLAALGETVRRLREERDLTQEELAARAGLSANYVGEIESGKRNPSALVLFALARGLGVEPARLLEGAR